MARTSLYTSRRRLSLREIHLAYRADRWLNTYKFPFGCAEVSVFVHPFVMARRPATRRPWTPRVSLPRVLPAGHDVLR